MSDEKLSLSHILKSTLAAAIGVQSNKNRERDFQHGNIWIYVLAGVLFTAIFVISLIVFVNIFLATA